METLESKIAHSKAIIQLGLRAYPNSFLACSFGKDSLVLVDLAVTIKPDIKVIGIDTGYEFPETLEFADYLIKEKDLNFEWAKPSPEQKEEVESRFGEAVTADGLYKCCEMKLPAITPKLESYDAWFTGLRRDEGPTRVNMQIIERGKNVKINPIAFWTLDDIWAYIKVNKLKYHPLYDEGYASLGCEPCTQKSDSEEGAHRQFERAGRFQLTKAGGECGLHTA